MSLEDTIALVHAACGNPSRHRSKMGTIWDLLSCSRCPWAEQIPGGSLEGTHLPNALKRMGCHLSITWNYLAPRVRDF